MPFRMVDPQTGRKRAKIHFVTYLAMPMQVNKAARKTGRCSNTQYIQHAVCEALARDLDLDLDDLLAELPTPKAQAATLMDYRRKTGKV